MDNFALQLPQFLHSPLCLFHIHIATFGYFLTSQYLKITLIDFLGFIFSNFYPYVRFCICLFEFDKVYKDYGGLNHCLVV